MTSPVIGISTYRESAQWGVWHVAADVLHAAYADAVRRAGGVPVLLPPGGPVDDAGTLVARLDALIIAGGADVDPTLYDDVVHERTGNWRPDRDAWELALLAAAEARGIPTLGICRGMQLMAVAAGGRLHQHVPDIVGHTGHGPAPGEFGLTAIRSEVGSRVAAAVGAELEMACHHHQSVATAPGYQATAWSPDGSVEAIERSGPRFCVGVQWHPEASADQGIIAALVTAASATR